MKIKAYEREKVLQYAEKWAYGRNPKYYNYDPVGGDCTNFASQCIYAGSQVMNYTKDTGWYYNNANNKAPAWTGVEFLYKFLINNKGVGPRGENVEIDKIQIGDIINLSFDGIKFTHTLIVVNIGEFVTPDNIYVASHTYDSYNRRLASYTFKDIRFVHISGVWKW